MVHTVIDLLRLSALSCRKLQLCGEVQHIPRPWGMVQLCRLRQSHPLTIEQCLNRLLGEGFKGAFPLAYIRAVTSLCKYKCRKRN